MPPDSADPFVVRIVPFQWDEAYIDLLCLRQAVLRADLPRYTLDQLREEAHDIHVALYRSGSSQAIGGYLIRQIGGWLQMRQVAVDPAEQKQGLGRRLVRHFEAHARERGVTRLFIEARGSAVDFYLRLGYHPTGETFSNAESTLENFRLEKHLSGLP